MSFSRTIRLVGSVSLIPILVLACHDDLVESDPYGLPEEIKALPPGLHPVISIPDLGQFVPGSVIKISIHLHAVDVSSAIASYQGEFGFPPDLLTIVRGDFTDEVLGAWNETSPGIVRFAGAVLDGVGSRPILELTVRATRRPSPNDFTVVIEEAIGAGQFADLTSMIPSETTPVLTEAVLYTGR